MSRTRPQAVARLLAETASEPWDLEPPADLLARIQSEIPEELVIPRLVPANDLRSPAIPIGSRRLLALSLAASVLLSLGGGFLALRVQDQAPPVRVAHPLPSAAFPEEKTKVVPRQVRSQPPQLLEMRPLKRLRPQGTEIFSEELTVTGEIPELQSKSASVATLLSPPRPLPALVRPRLESEAIENLKALGYIDGGALQESITVVSEVPLPEAFVATGEDSLSSFGLDVDATSYRVARQDLEEGHLPEKSEIRVEEMVNAFDYGDPPPARNDFDLRVEGAPTPFAPDERYRLLRFSARGRANAPGGILARDARAEVEFNPKAVARWRLLGYEDRPVVGEDFRDGRVDGSEIDVGIAVTALYEVELQPRAHRWRKLATLQLRYRSESSGKVETVERGVRLRDLAGSWEKASPALRLSSVAAELAEILRGSDRARNNDLAGLEREARALAAELAGTPQGSEVAELARLIAEAARLRQAEP